MFGSKKQEQPNLDLSKYYDAMSAPTSVSMPWGKGTAGGNSYFYTEDPSAKADRTMAEGIRSDLLKSLGLNNTPANDPWADLLMKESLRTAQPTLENALIGRGLGGSTVYKDALTDLISKSATNAALGSQSYKMNNLNALSSVLAQMYGLDQNTMNSLFSAKGLNQNAANSLFSAAGGDYTAQATNYKLQQDAEQQKWKNLTNLALIGGSLLATPLSGGTNLLSMGTSALQKLFGGGSNISLPSAFPETMMG